MIKLSEITPETTYADIKQTVEANLREGWGVPYEGIILMARTLDKLSKELSQVKARLADAQQRLPSEDAAEERRRLQKQKAAEAALRICQYFVNRPQYMSELVEQEKIDNDDFLLMLTYNGISTERYEG